MYLLHGKTIKMLKLYHVTSGMYDGLNVVVNPETNDLYISDLSIADALCVDVIDVEMMKASAEFYAGKEFEDPVMLMSSDLSGVITFIPMPLFTAFVLYQFELGSEQAKSLLLNGFSQSFHSAVLAQVSL